MAWEIGQYGEITSINYPYNRSLHWVHARQSKTMTKSHHEHTAIIHACSIVLSTVIGATTVGTGEDF